MQRIDLDSAPELQQRIIRGRDQIHLLKAVDPLRELGSQTRESVYRSSAGHLFDFSTRVRQDQARES